MKFFNLILFSFLSTLLFLPNQGQAQNYSFVVHSNEVKYSHSNNREPQIVNTIISFDEREVILNQEGFQPTTFHVVAVDSSRGHYEYEVLNSLGEYSVFRVYSQGENKRVIYSFINLVNEYYNRGHSATMFQSRSATFNILRIENLITNKQPLTPKEKLSKANLRNVFIWDPGHEHFSGPVKFLMSKQDFLQVYSLRPQSISKERDDFHLETLHSVPTHPSGGLSFKFNQRGYLNVFEMEAFFRNMDDLKKHFTFSVEPFLERLMGKSLTREQFYEKLNVNQPKDVDFIDYGFWFLDNIAIMVICEEIKQSNGRTDYTLKLGMEQFTDEQIKAIQGKD